MITLKCTAHPELKWKVKAIAVNADGSYNHKRHIFPQQAEECDCPATMLTFASPEEKAKWEVER